MARCPSCEYPLPDDRERLGARCPSCRDPLYEPPGRTGRPVRYGETACAVHKDNEALGPCARCGNYLCEVCRCKWREQILCAACVERAMQTHEGAPEQVRTHFRQALWGVILGGTGWAVGGFGYLLVLVAAAAQGEPTMLLALVWLMFLFSGGLVALFGLGQASAALLARGSHMILATIGLILSGLYLGLLIGMMSFSIWLV
jgi:hypothetical protein